MSRRGLHRPPFLWVFRPRVVHLEILARRTSPFPSFLHSLLVLLLALGSLFFARSVPLVHFLAFFLQPCFNYLSSPPALKAFSFLVSLCNSSPILHSNEEDSSMRGRRRGGDMGSDEFVLGQHLSVDGLQVEEGDCELLGCFETFWKG